MQDGTKRGVVALLKSDATVTANDRRRLLAMIANDGREPEKTEKKNRQLIVQRTEAAAMLGRSTRFIDSLARRGLLRKATLPGRRRAVGIIAADVERLVAISAAGEVLP